MTSELITLKELNQRLRDDVDSHIEAAVDALVHRTIEWRTEGGSEFIPLIDAYIIHLDQTAANPDGEEAIRRGWLHQLQSILHRASVGASTDTVSRASDMELIADILAWADRRPLHPLATKEDDHV